MEEPAENGLIAENQSRVRGKDHVGRSQDGRDQFDFPCSGENDVETVPLFSGQRSVGAIDIALHPGIDDIVDLEKLRRTHQITVRRSHS